MLLLAAIALAQTPASISIVPRPGLLRMSVGHFDLRADTRVAVTPETRGLGDMLQGYLRPGTGLPLDLTDRAGRNTIVLRLDRKLANLGAEGYQLDASRDRITIQAFAPAGVFYGIQTLRQMLPSDTLRKASVGRPRWQVPCAWIEDKPRFVWRGALVDVSRHFMPKEAVLRFIDGLAFHKLNTFHIHLTDDQGWRVEIKKYPKLTTVGAWHKANELTGDPTTWKTMPDGGFYSQDDIREIVAYAQARFINVVPEIEMPGHSMAIIASYPEYGNTGKQFEVPPVNGYSPDVVNASEHTVKFYQDVLTEVMELFPSKFIHVGGDEVGKDPWKKNPEMQAQIKRLGLKNEDELQSWFIRQMDTFLTQHGRRLIGWDEILEGGLAPGATVMSWRGIEGGIAAAKAGHDVVMAPTSNTYLDYYQSTNHDHEPRAIGGYVPLEKVYAYEPIPKDLTSAEAVHVLGAQGQLWTEYIPDPRHLEYMAYPRLCALAELTWSPAEGKSYPDFLNRLAPHLERLAKMDINFRPLDPGR
ncbi:beta-N-acetylhexosaminidase [Fimbriimonas ginsengisoli]|uniref:beta-N-acetylhexosaminidase n=1 Tax=Fimbriimonas ginsengisoli Gsoil 348 TaxID=661478 RepID=A0A068NPC6_FIMGI|nr:beta-N-acetylhexosaminidase [Fimbriimonas ginsengisoli]AIE85306.1 Beta-N-acetylhexosaminidase [Fimbriimonas ginsengisoli Gsoil 348]